MRQWKRQAAVLTAGVILTGTAGTEPAVFKGADAESICSVKAFAEQFSAYSIPEMLCDAVYFSPETQTVHCDGMNEAECREYFPVVSGKPAVSAKAAGIPGGARDYLTAEEATDLIGCEVTEQNGETVMRFPFQSERLIVKAETAPDPMGGTVLASGFRNLHVMQYASQTECYAAYLAYQQDPLVEYAEPDRFYQTAESSGNIPEKEYAWGRAAIGADSYIAWLEAEKEELPEVVVAVVDTGVYAEHNWLKDRVLTDRGVSFDEMSCGSWTDGMGHGTHCAGIVAQSTPENVKIMPVKVMNDRGWGSSIGIYCGIMYAIEQGADVISLSIGGKGDSPLEAEAVRTAKEAGIPCCTAAMNDGGNVYYGSLSGVADCITISAVDENKHLARYSNYGSLVDFAAPGSAINSAVPDDPDATEKWSGTSMATPFAAAAFADLLSYDPSLSFDEMYAYLKNNAEDLGDPGFDEQYGWGLINLRGFDFSSRSCDPPHIQIDGAVSGYVESDMPVDVRLLADAPEDEIYYTLDGSVPSKENGIRYTKQIVLDKSALLQAVSCRNGQESRIVSMRICISGLEVSNPYDVRDGVLVRYNGVLNAVDLRDIYPENELKAVGDGAFAGCRAEQIWLPASVKSLGSRLFADTEIRLFSAEGVTAVAESAFDGCVTLSHLMLGNIQQIGKNAFRDTSSVLGYVTLDNSLTVIPDGAFENSSLNVECDWSRLTEIGDHAFAGLEHTDTLYLSAVKTLGTGAFERARVWEVTFSEQLKELPDQAFMDAELYMLKAPGVTKIGAEALAVSQPVSDEIMIQFHLNYEKITAVGASAFRGYVLSEPLTFSSLSSLVPKAFDGMSGERIELPAVTALNSAALDGCRTLVSAPNAEQIWFEPVRTAFEMLEDGVPKLSYYALEVGSALQEIADGALSASPDYAGMQPEEWEDAVQYLTGPADSVLREYAEKYGIRYLPDHGICPAEGMKTTLTVQPLAHQTFRLVQVGEENSSLQWYTVRNGEETALTGEQGLSLEYVADKPGETIVRAVMSDDSGRHGQVDFHVTVPDFVTLTEEELLCADGETRLFDWNRLREEYAEHLIDGHILNCIYPFTADEAWDYHIALSPLSRESVLITDGEEIQIPDPVLADIAAFPLEQGQQYCIRLVRDYDDAGMPYSTLRIRRQLFSELQYADIHSAVKAADQGDFFLLDAQMNVLADQGKAYRIPGGVELENGTDYIAVSYYVPETAAQSLEKPGARTAMFGIGDYCGYRWDDVDAQNEYMLTGTLSADHETQIVRKQGFRLACAFVPETDGEYICYTVFPDERINENAADAFSIKAYAADGSALNNVQQSENSIVMTLTGGQTYYFVPGNGCTAIGISSKKNVLNAAYSIACDRTEIHAGDAVPAVTVSGQDVLKEGTDFNISVIGSAEKAGCLKLAVRGIGAYCGTVILSVNVFETVSAEKEIPLSAQSGRQNFRFVPAEDGEYTVYLMSKEQTDGNTARVRFEHADASGTYDTAVLKAGEAVSVYAENVTVPQSMVIRKGALLPLGGITAAEPYVLFSGEPVKAECIVTDPAGNLLEEGTDYVLEYAGNDRIGEMTMQAKGIGKYCGSAVTAVTLCGTMEADGMPQILEPGTAYQYLFTPEKDGIYSLRAAPSEACSEAWFASGEYDAETVTLQAEIHVSDEEKLLRSSYEVYPCGAVLGDCAMQADKQYLISVSNASDTIPAAVYLMKEKKHIMSLTPEVNPIYFSYTGFPQKVSLNLYDNETLLTEGTDFSFSVINDTEVGTMLILVKGLGNYCGEIILAEKIEPVNRFIDLEENLQYIPGGDNVFRFTLFIDTYLSVKKISGRGITLETTISDGWDAREVDSTPQLFSAGDYALRAEISGTPVFEDEPVVFCLHEAKMPLCFADLAGGTAVCTGEAIKPRFDVSYDGILLTEGADYDIAYEGKVCEPGNYRVTITGKGRCYDSCDAIFTVLPAWNQAQTLLNEGEICADIPAGQSAFFDWTPAQASYILTKHDLRNAVFCLYDANGSVLWEMQGIGYQCGEMQVQPGEQYRLGVSFRDHTAAGAVSFALSSAAKMLEQCTVDIAQTVVWNKEPQMPEFTLKDGETVLTEGKDYEISACGGMTHIGRCCLTLRGRGAYAGEKKVYYFSVPQKLTDAPDPQRMEDNAVPEYNILLDKPVTTFHGLHGTAGCFAYTAEHDGKYYLTLPDSETDEVAAFVYDADGTLLPPDTTEISLNAGETCRIFCVSNFYVERDIEKDQPYYLEFSQYPHPFTVHADGLTFRIAYGKAILTGVDDDVLGISVPETVTDPSTSMAYPFGGIDAAALGEEIDRITVYGVKNGAVEAYCRENGYCFALPDGESADFGDLTGDGITDFADAMTLQRYVTEGQGILFTETQLEAADINNDGYIDSDDVTMLFSMAAQKK